MRKLLETRPLWDAPGAVGERQADGFLGAEPHTPSDEAVGATLRAPNVIRGSRTAPGSVIAAAGGHVD